MSGVSTEARQRGHATCGNSQRTSYVATVLRRVRYGRPAVKARREGEKNGKRQENEGKNCTSVLDFESRSLVGRDLCCSLTPHIPTRRGELKARRDGGEAREKNPHHSPPDSTTNQPNVLDCEKMRHVTTYPSHPAVCGWHSPRYTRVTRVTT